MEMIFPRQLFGKRFRSMLKVDFRRMFTMPLLYILTGACLVMPVLILVMTTMMDGSVTVDPTTGVTTVIEGFQNTWQIISTESGTSVTASMDMTSMCNINLLYFFTAVLVCVFTADDFRAGFSKNLFTIRAKKNDYIASKTLVCFVGGALMILAFFLGSILGGAISGLSFDTGTAGVTGIALCLLAKLLLVAVFVPMYLLWSVCSKQKLWLSLTGSLCTGMFMFMMIPVLTPLDATPMHTVLCLTGGLLFSFGLGAIGSKILQRTSLV